MKDGVSSLESLAALNIELEPKRRVRSRVRLLDIARGLSSSLYRAVSSSLETLGDPLSLYTTASRLLRGVSQASSNYGTAVSRCIDGKIQGQNLNLEFETDRHKIYSEIIALLEEDLNNSCY